MKETSTGQRTTGPRTEPLRGMELLWQPEVVSTHLTLTHCLPTHLPVHLSVVYRQAGNITLYVLLILHEGDDRS